MANASYDTLTITINADSKEANRSIATLNRNLNNLDKTSKNLDTRRLGEIKGLLLNIAKIDFSNVSKGLQDIVSAFKYFQNKTAQKTSPIFSTFTGKNSVKNYTEAFQNEFYGGVDVSKLNYELEKTPNIIAKANKEVGKLKQQVKDVQKEATKTSRNFGKMFFNILKYRVVRRLIQSIFQEIQQGFQDLAMVDSDFNESMSIIKSSLSFVARSLVSVIAPVIKALAPIIQLLAQSLNDVANTLGSALAGSLGETFYEASESVDDYAESLKKAKSITMGFDELNIISQDGGDKFQVGEAKQMSGALGELIATLTRATSELLIQLTPQIQNIIFALVRAIEKAVPLIVDGTELALELVSLTDDSVNDSVALFIETLGASLKLIARIVRTTKPFLAYFVLQMARLLNIINQVISLVFLASDTFITLFEGFGGLLPTFFSEGFEGVKKQWVSLLNDLGIAWANFGVSLLNPIINVIKNIVGMILKVVNTFIGYYNNVAGYLNLPTLPILNNPIRPLEYQSDNFIPYNSQNNQGSGDIVIQLDGETIAKVVNKRNDNRGANLGFGGSINWNKGF